MIDQGQKAKISYNQLRQTYNPSGRMTRSSQEAKISYYDIVEKPSI